MIEGKGERREHRKVGLPQDTRPGVSRLRSETNREGRRGREVTLTSECTQWGLLSSEPSSTPAHSLSLSQTHICILLSLPRTSHGEVCNVFDLMHSRNKVYCRVACVAGWIHFS